MVAMGWPGWVRIGQAGRQLLAQLRGGEEEVEMMGSATPVRPVQVRVDVPTVGVGARLPLEPRLRIGSQGTTHLQPVATRASSPSATSTSTTDDSSRSSASMASNDSTVSTVTLRTSRRSRPSARHFAGLARVVYHIHQGD
jgi:hypothetical protein